MRRWRGFGLLLLAGLAGCGKVVPEQATIPAGAASGQEGIVVRDDVGREVRIRTPVRSVVAINSYDAELVLALAGAQPLAGYDDGTLQRLGYLRLDRDRRVGQNMYSVNHEQIVRLAPDVVIIPRNGVWQETAERLAPFGIPVLVVTGWDPARWKFNVDLLGRLLGKQDRAARILAFTDGIERLLAERTAGLERPAIYYEDAALGRSAGANSGKTAFIDRAGGRNIFGDVTAAGGLAIDIDPAQVLRSDPELIFVEVAEKFGDTDPDKYQAALRALYARPGWSGLKALRNHRVYVYNAWPLNLAGWNIAGLYVAKWAHPQAFADVEPSDYAARWAREFLGVDYPGDAHYILAPGANP